MLEKVLEAERFPGVLVRASGGDSSMEASITLHGLERRVPIPVQIDSNETVLNASGEFAIRHTDFGMTPFSVFGGALAVKDRIDIRFHIVAERVRDGDALAAPD